MLLLIAMILPLGAKAQMTGTGAISGTVTDQSGAVIAKATVSATSDSTSVATVRLTTNAGDYNITPLAPGDYTVTVVAKGFETYVQKNVSVDALQTVAVNMKLTVGAAEATIVVSSAPPVLETTDAQIGAVMDNEMYTSLPLIMGASGQPDQRRATDFSYLMPGVQNTYAASAGGNPTDATGAVNGGNPGGGTSEIYIDGVNLPEGDGVGDPRYTWTAFGVDSIDQFQVESAGYPAQYAGQGVQNYSVKSGGNQIHGSVYEFIRNTALDAWVASSKTPTATGLPIPAGALACNSISGLTASTPYCALGGIKSPEHQNEFGGVISGPIIKNKLFLFYNYGQYRYVQGAVNKLQTVPTLAMMGYSSAGQTQGYADFSGYAQFYGKAPCTIGSVTSPCYDVYDPASQTVLNCQTSACKRTIFPNDQIPANRFSTASAYINKFMLPYEAQANQTLYSNNISTGYSTGLSNWYQTGHLDYDQSEKNQVSLIIAFGRQSVAYGIGLAGAGSGNGLLPPFATAQFYAPTTNVDILKDTYTVNPHLVNQAGLAFARYKSLDSNHNEEPPYTAAAIGLLNTPPGQPSIGFPGISFSGGAVSANNEGGYSWHGQLQNTYTAMDNLQWQHGKHNVTFGGQGVDVQFTSWTTTGASPLTYTFSGTQTEGYNASGAGLTTGNSFASYMLGAVSSSSVSLSPEWSARWLSPSFWVQDDFKVTPKLTLNLGLRWDLFGTLHEAHNQWTWLNPVATNLNTGNYGTLAFAGGSVTQSPYTGLKSPSALWYRNLSPRLGIAYALDSKTVVRASYGVAYARGNWTAGGGGQKLPSQMGTVPAASAPAGLSNAPSFYWDASACSGNASGFANDGFTPCGWTGSTTAPATLIAQEVSAGRMPIGATLAEYGTAETATEKNTNNGSPGYFDPYLGSRSPEYINWSLGFQRQLTKSMSATVSYVGSEGHFISVSKAIGARNNELPESMAALAGYALPTATSTVATPCTGAGCQYSLLGQKATTNGANMIAQAQAFGFTPPNPYTNPQSTGPGGYYQSNTVAQYYQPFPQYSGVSDQTSFVGNENWNALEVSVRQRMSSDLDFMVNYTWSKGIDDLGTFRVGDNTRLDRSISAANQPQNLVATAVYKVPVGRNHMWGDNLLYRSIVSDWKVSGTGLEHSGLPMLIVGSGCAGSGILNQCMPSVVAGQAGRQNRWDKTAAGSAVSWDPNNANYIGKVDYINPTAFTVVNAGTCSTNAATTGAYHTFNGQAYNVCSGPEDYALGTAGRVAPIKGLYTQPSFNIDMSLRRTFPIHERWKLELQADVTNVTNHVVLAGPGSLTVSTTSASAPGNFGVVSKIGNSPRDIQGGARISW